MHAAIPLAWHGTIPQVRPLYAWFPVTSAYSQIKPIATSHSMSDETWITHVGSESALAGSARLPNRRETSFRRDAAEVDADAFASKAYATSAPATTDARAAVAANADQPRSAPPTELPSTVFFPSKPPPPPPPRASRSPSRMPTTINRLVMVSRDSAGPCSQSTLARMSSYRSLAKMAHGMVPNTNASRNLNPNSALGGICTSGLPR